MAHALTNTAETSVAHSRPAMTFQSGGYTYTVSSDGKRSCFAVTDGRETITEPIPYVFGNGYVAQTYVLQHGGKLYEGRVSYYTGKGGLDWTLGDALHPPPNLEEAFGRDISGDEARNCFSCHGTAAIANNQLRLDSLIPGVGCEACHGPGGRHVAAMSSASVDKGYIFNPKTLSREVLAQEFCGACHRSANAVGMMPDLGGINNVRFQPYRISLSRGHDANAGGLSCTGCHDPHVDLVHEAGSYDDKCTRCHVARSPNARQAGTPSAFAKPTGASAGGLKSCPVSARECVSCHMPKVELPGAHFQFTDHNIRIARPQDKYPF